MEKFVDWHTHTIYSDGRDDPETVVRNSKALGIESLAITDHDSMGGYREAKDLAKKWGIEIVPGVEVSTQIYHILGLNVNPDNLDFVSFLQKVRDKKLLEWQEKMQIIRSKGIPINMNKVRNYFNKPEQRIGKFNVYMSMMMDEDCRIALKEKGYELNSKDLHRFFGKDGLLGKIPDTHYVTSRETIEQIHNAGGIAVVAHPFKQVECIDDLDGIVKEGLDGIEIQPNYGDRNIPSLAYAERKRLPITYGSDFHGASYTRPLLGRGENRLDVEKALGVIK